MIDAAALSRRIAARTAVAWVVGVLLLASLCIAVTHRSQQRGIDSRLRAHAMAAYGLAWWDEDGSFHDEILRKEPELYSGDVHISFATPQSTVFGPSAPEHPALVAQAMATEEAVWLRSPRERTLAIATYDDADRLCGAVIATMSTGAAQQATVGFGAATLAASLVLILVGMVVSRRLSAHILGALEESIQEREHILAGAAHELRTPMATLLALVDSTPPEQAAQTLVEVRQTAADAAGLVDRLLTWSQLAHTTPVLEPVRLDLLVELCLTEHEPLEAEASVVLTDPRLLRVAINNLLHNARTHGGGVRCVRVAAGAVEVHDHGDGVPADHRLAPFSKGMASTGSGLGLALVQRIAEKHGGTLKLRPVVTLVLPQR